MSELTSQQLEARDQAHRQAMACGQPQYVDPQTGFLVWTAAHLAAKGTCCHSGCRHCPYGG